MIKQYRTIFTDAINITNSTEEGKRPTTSYRNACNLHPTPLFNSSCTLYLYHTAANAPYRSQFAANFKCSNHPTFLLEGLSLQLDARQIRYWSCRFKLSLIYDRNDSLPAVHMLVFDLILCCYATATTLIYRTVPKHQSWCAGSRHPKSRGLYSSIEYSGHGGSINTTSMIRAF
jgi:hypothetical protein